MEEEELNKMINQYLQECFEETIKEIRTKVTQNESVEIFIN